jgi:hypothetical protein
MNNNRFLPSLAIAISLTMISCKSDKARTPFYGKWTMTELINSFGTLNFENPDDYVQQLSLQLLKEHFSEGGPGEGRTPTADDSASFRTEAKWIVSVSMLPRRIRLIFDKPDKVTVVVLERDAMDNKYVEANSKTGTFEVDPQNSLLILNGVHLTDSSESIRWKYQFASPDRLHITEHDTSGYQKPMEKLIFFKEP